jgi:YegS/Rv2252/BmrU family lipid kinase
MENPLAFPDVRVYNKPGGVVERQKVTKPGNKWAFIVNPRSGSGLGGRMLEELRVQLGRRGIDAPVFETRSRGHAVELADRAVREGAAALGIVGGDGTVNEALQAIPEASPIAFGIVPAGSGNDYAEAAAFSRRFGKDDWDRFFEKRTVRVDTGICNGRRFLNGVGMGFDARIAAKVQNPGFFPGPIRYRFHILANLLFYRPYAMTIENGGRHDEKRVLMTTVGIGRRFGGGFYITPRAEIDDGLFDICLVRDLGTLGRIRKMLDIIGKRHIGTPGVEYFRSEKLRIEFQGETDAHIDGEIFRANRFDIEIRPASLLLIRGGAGSGYFRESDAENEANRKQTVTRTSGREGL